MNASPLVAAPVRGGAEFGPLESFADVAGFRAALDQALESSDPQAALVDAAKTFQDEGRRAIQEHFEQTEYAGLPAGKALAALQDEIVQGLFRAAEKQYPLPHPTSSERLSIVAVGGYGRGGLAPQSDIDLLFLLPYKRTAWAETLVETILYALWDLGLKVGQATRSVDECLRLAKSDMTIRTSLLETRLITGDRELYGEMKNRLWGELFSKTAQEFVTAKLEERRDRHARTGGSRYMLEPNIKEGKGALRDLHSLFWIGKYLYNADSAADLIEHGVFTQNEARRFAEAEKFFWTVRFWLHYLTGRPNEQLTFERQIEIASNMGFCDSAGLSSVERFMRHYFTVAKEVGDLTRIVCASLESQHLATKRQGMRRLLGMFTRSDDEPMQIEHGRILISDPAIFRDTPLEILRLFHVAGKTNTPIHPQTLKLVRRNLDAIDETMRTDPEANALFLNMLCDSPDPEDALRSLNEAGVLGAFMPEFGEIVCMMQFNMYHYYTVDEHTIRAVGNLAQIEQGRLTEEAPVSTSIMKGSLDRRALYVAILLHDIGKGRTEDHSIVGARLAETICPRLGLSDADTETVVWLIRHHLLMSDTAQKRDLADIRTIQDFAATVQSRERLKMLLVLTTCDIRAVGPGVWNGWKAQLLRSLYAETEALLSAGHDAMAASRSERIEEAKAALADRLRDWSSDRIEAFSKRHYPPYWLGLDLGTHETHARMLEGQPDDAFVIDASGDPARSGTRLSVAMGDHPGLFSRITGAVSISGASIVDARTFTTSDGMAIATLWLQDQDGEAYNDPSRLSRLKTNITRVMSGEMIARDALRERDTIKPRERSFKVAPDVNFDNTASELYTVIEVTGRDRLGLVHDLSRALADQKVSIFSAVIATYGERAVDTFYVKDLFGHKIANPNRQLRIEEALQEVLARED
jgi:[protein-PII] uridylyltransferase